MAIFKLKPSCKDYLWGGTRLRTEFGIEYDKDPLAESWELSCHPDGPSYIVNGENAGKKLHEYVEEMVSDDTVSFVREHLKDCPRCRAELEKLQKPVEVQLKPDINAAPLKRLKKALLMKKLQTTLCTVAILLALMLAVISLLTAPEYFEYTPDLVTVTETGVGEVTISFNSKVTNYKLQHIEDPDE